MKKKELHIDVIGIKKAAFLVRAVNHPVRQSMLRVMSREGMVTVTTLCRELNLLQPVASSHLAVLRRASVVITRREGHHIFYSVNHDRMERLNEELYQFLK